MRPSLPSLLNRFASSHAPSPLRHLAPWLLPAAPLLWLLSQEHPVQCLGKSTSDVLNKAGFKLGKRLGEGGFAVVWEGKDQQGTRVAIKEIDKKHTDTESFQREVAILKAVGSHESIIRLISVLETSDKYLIIMELAEGGELFEKLAADGPYSEKDASELVKQMAAAISFLHDQSICHRDLKPENMLLNHEGRVKVSDFGLSGKVGARGEETKRIGTWEYWSPEVFGSEFYGPEVDMWSLGVIVFIILSGYHPFDPSGLASENIIKKRIKKGKCSFNDPAWKVISKEGKDLVMALLQVDASKRLTASQLLSHPWLIEADAQPLPSSDSRMGRFNNSRRYLRATISAVLLAHGGGEGPGTRPATGEVGPEQIEEMMEAFALFDKDRSGSIDQQEMQHAMRSLGLPASNEQVADMMKKADENGDGVIDFQEFCTLMQSRMASQDQSLRKAFAVFDENGDGYISGDELAIVLRKLGRHLSNEEVKKMVADADENGDGMISYEEFTQLMSANPSASEGGE